MNLTPEQQKELLDAALEMSDYINEKEPLRDVSIDQHLVTAEKFRPKPEKPKLLEGWVNEYPHNKHPSHPGFWTSPEAAIRGASSGAIRTSVHMREVVPPDESQKWYYTSDGSITHFPSPSASSQRIIGRCGDSSEAIKIARAHNAALGFGKEGE